MTAVDPCQKVAAVKESAPVAALRGVALEEGVNRAAGGILAEAGACRPTADDGNTDKDN